MQSSHFGFKSLLIAFAVVALWLSTFAGYRGGEDIRAFIMISIFITSGVAALSHTARRRAFWLGFFGTMLMVAMRGMFTTYSARFAWVQQLSRDLSQPFPIKPSWRGELETSINMTIVFAVTLAMSALIGLLCVHVYDQCRKIEEL